MFPSVGSTVTRVVTNKSGTTAKVEFDDGTSLLVKYEALVIDESSPAPKIEKPVRNESRVLMSGGAKVPKLRTSSKTITSSSTAPDPVLNESAYKALAAKALKRQSARQEKAFSSWERETGQFDHQAGPV
jgi:hypothetical protein